MPTLRLIDEAALRRAVTPARAVDVIRDAFRADGERRTRVPPVINLDIPEEHGEFHVKTAYIAGVPHIAVKIASGFYGNAARGLPSGSGLMVRKPRSARSPTNWLIAWRLTAARCAKAVTVVPLASIDRNTAKCERRTSPNPRTSRAVWNAPSTKRVA